MFRNIVKRYITLGVVFPLDFFNSDAVKGKTKTEQSASLENSTESGWDRVIRIFRADEFGNLSMELVTIMNVSALSLFVGAIYGGVNYSRNTYVNFIKNNQATAFRDPIDAKKQLRDSMTLSFGKGAFKWSWRLALFTTNFITTYTIIQAYRGKYGIIEYVIAGAFSGASYKFNAGPRGWIVGGGLGAVLGLVGGGMTNLLMSLTGMNMDEVRYWQMRWKQQQEVGAFKKYEEQRQKENMILLYEHNLKHKQEDEVKANKELLESLPQLEVRN